MSVISIYGLVDRGRQPGFQLLEIAMKLFAGPEKFSVELLQSNGWRRVRSQTGVVRVWKKEDLFAAMLQTTAPATSGAGGLPRLTFEIIYGSSVSSWGRVLSSQFANASRWALKDLQLQATFGPYRRFLNSGADVPTAWTVTIEYESTIDFAEFVDVVKRWRSRLAAKAVTADLIGGYARFPLGNVIARLLRAGYAPQLNRANSGQFLKPGRLLISDRSTIDAVASQIEGIKAVAHRLDEETLEVQQWPESIAEESLGLHFATSHVSE